MCTPIRGSENEPVRRPSCPSPAHNGRDLLERLPEGKIRVTSLAWDEPKVFLAGQSLEVRNKDGVLVLARKGVDSEDVAADKAERQRDPFAYLCPIQRPQHRRSVVFPMSVAFVSPRSARSGLRLV